MNLRRSIVLAATVATASVLAPVIGPDQQLASYGCHALVIDPVSALNLERPYALRYKSAPLRLCMPDDTNRISPHAIG
jgi:hypothetical protein